MSQDYAEYSAIDQAVWRFVLLQMHARLVETAHPAYSEGLAATGISVERIPSIAEMSEKLARFGWGAVCVDGFIPPRAFQEFQARGLLPIAADMRTREHIAYTPAPDIIHEAAGHAPILPEPGYAAYLRRIGEIGTRAFTVPEEERVFQASYTLSEVKEDPSATPATVARVEAELSAAIAAVPEDSEAAWISRLYWWTAEYGLIGTPADYRLYGAGLLSSLGESYACHAPSVQKLPLDERCIHLDYDITRPQPQLFVARSFEQLHELLDRVAKELAFERGGEIALQRAARSRELASFRFSTGRWALGVLHDRGGDAGEPAWLHLAGPVAFARDGRIHELERDLRLADHFLPVGPLANGDVLHAFTERDLAAHTDDSGRLHLRFARGAELRGRVRRTLSDESGHLLHAELEDARLELPGRAPLEFASYLFVPAGDFVTAQAGAVDSTFHSETTYPDVRIPKPRHRSAAESRALELFEGVAALPAHGPDVAAALSTAHAELTERFPQEWLLRWNLLERAQRLPEAQRLASTLAAELETLEVQFERREPIAMGLRYLRENRGR